MEPKILQFVHDFNATHGPFDRVLDIGALDINGAVRDVIKNCRELIGVDMRAGKGVDLVANSNDLDKHFPPESFDLVTWCETLEHDLYFWVTVQQVHRVLKPGGWFLVTTPGIRHARHGHPNDYYRIFETVLTDFVFKGYEEVFAGYDMTGGATVEFPNTIAGYARKPR